MHTLLFYFNYKITLVNLQELLFGFTFIFVINIYNPNNLISDLGSINVSKETILSAIDTIQNSIYLGGILFNGNICLKIIFLVLSFSNSGK